MIIPGKLSSKNLLKTQSAASSQGVWLGKRKYWLDHLLGCHSLETKSFKSGKVRVDYYKLKKIKAKQAGTVL